MLDLSYKSDLDQNIKTDILNVDNRAPLNDDMIEASEVTEDLSQQFNKVCSQFLECISENNPKNIMYFLKVIRRSANKFKESCLQQLIQFNILEIITNLMDHEDNKIRIKAARTILILIKNIRNIIQFFEPIPNFSGLLFDVINTCNDIDGIYFGLFSLYYFFKKYYITNSELFSQLSIQYLDAIYQFVDKYDADIGYAHKIYVYKYIALFYRKLCKRKIEQNECEIVISFIVAIFSTSVPEYTCIFPDLFKVISNLITYDSMPINIFFENSFHRYTINEIILNNPQSTVRAFNLLSSVLNKGNKFANFLKLSAFYTDQQSKELIKLASMQNQQDKDEIEIFFDNFINNVLVSIDIDENQEIAASATRMLASAIRNDDEMLIINYLTTNQNNNYGFLSIVNNLCHNESAFSLIQASAYCLMDIILRIDQTRFLDMNNIIYSSREDGNLETIHRSLVNALITIATLDDEEIVFHSLNQLINLTNISDATGMMSNMIFDYSSVGGYDKLKDISDQNDNPDINILCEQIMKMYTSRIKSAD